MFLFSPLQLLVRGDLQAFEPTSAPAEASDGALPTSADEQFLDTQSCPSWTASGSLARYEETLGAHFLSAGSSAERRVKLIWSAQVLPGFHWTVVAVPIVTQTQPSAHSGSARQLQHSIIHTASLIRDGKVVVERGGRAMAGFLSQQRVADLGGPALRLLAIAFGVPQLISVPLSEHNAPQFLAPQGEKPWSFVFFHQTDAVTKTSLFALKNVEEVRAAEPTTQDTRARSGTQLFYAQLAGGTGMEKKEEQSTAGKKHAPPVPARHKPTAEPPTTTPSEPLLVRTCLFRNGHRGPFCLLRSSAPSTTDKNEKPIWASKDGPTLLAALPPQDCAPYPVA